MSCEGCLKWVTAKKRQYKDGSQATFFEAQPGLGLCEVLTIQTRPDFGCVMFEPGGSNHVVVVTMEGEPWQFWKMGACPDCAGRGCGEGEGGGRCYRCQGLGQVRHYEDGYIGEERTRRHPKEPPESTADPLLDGRILAPLPQKADLAGKDGVV